MVLKKEPDVIAKFAANLATEVGKLDRNGLTFAGRALQKHMSRPGSIYPQVAQTAESLNSAGAGIVREILEHPDTIYKQIVLVELMQSYRMVTGSGMQRTVVFMDFLNPNLMNPVDTSKFWMIVSGDPNYEDLVAEIDFCGEFFCIVSQDNGIDNLNLQIASRKDGKPWEISAAELVYIIEIAKKRLWELRRV